MIFAFFAAILNAALISNIVATNQVGLEAQETPKGRILPMFIYAAYVGIMALIIWLIGYPIYQFLLVPLNLGYLDLMMMGILMIAVTQGAYLLLSNKKIGKYLPQNKYVILNTALLFIVFSGLKQASFLNSLTYVLGADIGFIGVLSVYQTIISRLNIAPIPKAFKGIPIILIILGLIAIALAGINGIF